MNRDIRLRKLDGARLIVSPPDEPPLGVQVHRDMSQDAVTLTAAQKLKLLRQIQYRIGQERRPLARACGLTEDEFAILADEELIEVTFFQDAGPDLDRYNIERILPKGDAILVQAFVAEPDPLRVSVVPQHKSIYKRIFEGTRSGLWDLIKIAFGAVLGWLLKKHFP